ncbi:MAG: endopeptidase La [Planctomycetota bacterium]|nr:MAG: endopeptidase La [Planctomycetota bacterium]
MKKRKKTDETNVGPETAPTNPAEGDAPAESNPQTAGASADADTTGGASGQHVLVPLPVLPLRNTVVFPVVFAPLTVGRPGSIAAVEAALATEEKTLVVVAQKDPEVEEPSFEDLHQIGTRAVIKKLNRSAEDLLQVLIQGIERVRLVNVVKVGDYLQAVVEPYELGEDDPAQLEAARRAVLERIQEMLELINPERAEQLQQFIRQTEDPIHIVYLLGSLLELESTKEQALLEAPTRTKALELLHEYLTHEVQVLQLRQQIQSKARSEISKEQRQYLLRQQLEAIKEELGESSPEQAELEELRKQLEEADLPELVRKEAERELKRLERLPPHAPDYQVTRTYLELIAELPWNKQTEDQLDLAQARQILDEDHYDLQEVKDRILEHLAVMKLNPNAEAPILCFVGPPGVGKTSLGKSIARALGRKFERISLGGMHDESELRGHRRTYIGSMPGRIIQAIRRAGVKNPVLMLDEVDKLGRDFRGDPAAALLEILDPAQNESFRDNYLDLPFDLSKVFFICTANTLDTIPRPLLDRMEVLRLSGYTTEEKRQIARRYLIPRQLEASGVPADLLEIPDDTLTQIITRYTREAGVRQLERAIGRIARKVAMRIAEGKKEKVIVRPEDLPDFLGKEVYRPEQSRRHLQPGVATGLAWTESGGEILYVEAALLPEGSGIRLTGQLGDVMKESAEAALSYVWAHADQLGIDVKKLRNNGIHIHVPAGAVPKDGPSAGVAMVTALASLLAGIPARADVAMTGEITLSGRVLPVGGIKEKVLAARAAGIDTVVLPKANENDLRELPEEVRQEMNFVLVETIDELLQTTIPDLARKTQHAPEPAAATE